MLKNKYMVFIAMLLASLSQAQEAPTLSTSNHLNNFKVVIDTACSRSEGETPSQREFGVQIQAQVLEPGCTEEVAVRSQQSGVETVNYKLKGYHRSVYFPVTVRSHQREGLN